MSVLRSIPIEDIDRRSDCRAPDDDTISALADSIERVGLINPIRVRQKGERFELVAGSHRFAACDALDFREIPAFVVEDDDLHAELAMIDENLCRAELSPSDRARQTARRKAIYEELHPETKAGTAQANGMNRSQGNVAANLATTSFTEATAAATGSSERAVRRDAERGEKVIDEVLDMVRGTKLDTGTYLDRIKKLPPNEQVHAARRDLSADRRQDRETAARQPAPAPKQPQPGEAYVRFVELADELEGLRVGDIVAGAGRQRSVLGQRASGLADMMGDLMEGLAQ